MHFRRPKVVLAPLVQLITLGKQHATCRKLTLVFLLVLLHEIKSLDRVVGFSFFSEMFTSLRELVKIIGHLQFQRRLHSEM